MTRSRRNVRPPDLTSLFDVLFLFVFVALVNAGVARKQADEAIARAAPAPAPAPVKAPADFAGLHDRALASLASRTEVVARVSKDGALARIELPDRSISVGVPLVERVADPDVGVAYLGDRDAALHVCAIVAQALGAADLRDYLVIVAPDAPLAELTVALASGLRRDADRCLVEDRGVAIVIDAAALAAPHPGQGATP